MDIAVALIAGLFGGFVGYLLQVFVSVRSSELQAISDQIDDLRRVEQFCVEYWMTEPQNKAACRELAAKLRGALSASSTFEETGPSILGCRFEKYVSLTTKLDDIATGGKFESRRDDVEPERVTACMRTVGELVSHLRTCRKYVFLWR